MPTRLRSWAGGVRARTTLAATLIVAAALLVGAIALVTVMRDVLSGGVESAATLRAAEIAALLADGVDELTPGLVDEDEGLVQVIDADGRVIAASSNMSGRPPVAQLRPGQASEITTPVDDGPFIAVATRAETPDGPVTVIVARALEDVLESTQVVSELLAIGLPLLLVAVALVTWTVVGRALAPVEAMRREVDAISAAELHRRVPATGTQDEIGRLATTMNRMLDRLDRSQARQRRFVSDASHELRSPVASIRQHAEVALAHPERTTTSELADTVLSEDLRIERLVADLLLLARADEHTLGLHVGEVDLDDLALDEARRLRTATSLTVDTTQLQPARVSGDATSLARVLRNLGENAARHARARVAFALALRGGAAVLHVEDDGPGIPEAERQRVFERFVRLDEARARDAGGSGLGLAIVAELVAAHGGTVRILDSQLGGARLEVVLPGLA